MLSLPMCTTCKHGGTLHKEQSSTRSQHAWLLLDRECEMRYETMARRCRYRHTAHVDCIYYVALSVYTCVVDFLSLLLIPCSTSAEQPTAAVVTKKSVPSRKQTKQLQLYLRVEASTKHERGGGCGVFRVSSRVQVMLASLQPRVLRESSYPSFLKNHEPYTAWMKGVAKVSMYRTPLQHSACSLTISMHCNVDRPMRTIESSNESGNSVT